MAQTFRWLHLTDLHWGHSGVRAPWNSVKNKFYECLERLVDRSRCGGPWDVVFFTGDLVNTGDEKEYDQFNKEFLLPLWERLEQIQGSRPKLIPVPGNHDLERPKSEGENEVTLFGLHSAFDPKQVTARASKIQGQIWKCDKNTGGWKIIENAFANYKEWWAALPSEIPKIEMKPGLLPGEFAATFTRDSVRIGLLGLNTAFLQLEGENYYQRLAMNGAQCEAASGDIGQWEELHHLRILLTHHPSDWLAPKSLEEYENEVSPIGRFGLHLSGHTHQNAIVSMAQGGTKARNTVSTLSLFGSETYTDKQGKPQNDRVNGFGAGRIDFSDSEAKIYLWSLEAEKLDAGGWHFKNAGGQEYNQDDSLGPFTVPLKKIERDEPRRDATPTEVPDSSDPLTHKMIARIGQIIKLPQFEGLPVALLNVLKGKGAVPTHQEPVRALFANRSYDEIHTLWHQAVQQYLETRKDKLDGESYAFLLECIGWIVLEAVDREHLSQTREDLPFLHLEIPVLFEFSFAIVFGWREGAFAQFSFGRSKNPLVPLEAMGMVCRPKLPDRGGEIQDWLDATGKKIWEKTEIDPRQYHGEFKSQGQGSKFVFRYSEMAEELRFKIEETHQTGPKLKPFVLMNPERNPMSVTEKAMAEILHRDLKVPIVAYGEEGSVWKKGVWEKQVKVKLENYFKMLEPHRKEKA